MVDVKYKMAEGCEDLAPKQMHEGDAGFDLYSREDVEIHPGETKVVMTGLFTEFPSGYELQVRPRSGIAAKQSVIVTNSPGTVDAGYRNEIGVILSHLSNLKAECEIQLPINDEGFSIASHIIRPNIKEPFVIKRGDRIAQAVIAIVPTVNFIQAGQLSDSSRGKGGFGSTGI